MLTVEAKTNTADGFLTTFQAILIVRNLLRIGSDIIALIGGNKTWNNAIVTDEVDDLADTRLHLTSNRTVPNNNHLVGKGITLALTLFKNRHNLGKNMIFLKLTERISLTIEIPDHNAIFFNNPCIL